MEKWGESGNVYENKGSYPLKVGICMKTGRLMCLGRKTTRTSLPFFPPQRADRVLENPPRRKFFLNELCRNVYENKGPLWKSKPKPGMFMKIKVVIRSKSEYV